MDGSIDFHRYRLHAARSLNSRSTAAPREGAWLRLRRADGATGFADLCPFPELGDATLEAELRALAAGAPLAVGARSLHFARLDASARARGVELIDPGLRIENHFLVDDISRIDAASLHAIVRAGYRKIKIKLGRDLEIELLAMHRFLDLLQNLREIPADSPGLRLDFNARPAVDELQRFLDRLRPRLAPRLDFIEDPCAYSARTWSELAAGQGVRLALDLAADPLAGAAEGAEGADVIVVKPAVQDSEAIVEVYAGGPRSLVFTHYMDSALGQMFALMAAQRAARRAPLGVCGLQCQPGLFAPSPMQDAVGAQGPFIAAPAGPGIGFGAWLECCDWRELKIA